jgi:hypothetical protein
MCEAWFILFLVFILVYLTYIVALVWSDVYKVT